MLSNILSGEGLSSVIKHGQMVWNFAESIFVHHLCRFKCRVLCVVDELVSKIRAAMSHYVSFNKLIFFLWRSKFNNLIFVLDPAVNV